MPTLLRIVAALEPVSKGEMYLDGELHDKSNKDTLLLFQDFNQLFPWKTVINNIVYAMTAAKVVLNKKTQ